MTGTEIKAQVDAMTHDSMGDTVFYGLLNSQRVILEGERDWAFLSKLDSSQTLASGATSSTTKSLPSDFGMPRSITIGSETTPRALINIDDSRVLNGTAGCWFIDWVAGTYAFTGTEGAGGTIYNRYTRVTPALTSSTSPAWPAAIIEAVSRYLALQVAKAWFYQDAGEREFNWSKEWAMEAQALKDTLVMWDERFKAMCANSSGTPVDMSNGAQIA